MDSFPIGESTDQDESQTVAELGEKESQNVIRNIYEEEMIF